MRAVVRSVAVVALVGACFLAGGVAEAGPAVMLNPYYHGAAGGFAPAYDAHTPHGFAYWYGHGTPGPGYWAGYAPAFAFPSIPPTEYYPAYGNDFAGYRGTSYAGPIGEAAVLPETEACPCGTSAEGSPAE